MTESDLTMLRRTIGYQKAANNLAAHGLLEEFIEFVEKYRDKISIAKTIISCFCDIDSGDMTDDYICKLIDYYCTNNDAYDEKGKSKILKSAIKHSKCKIATYMISLGAIPRYKHVEVCLTHHISDCEFFRLLMADIDMRGYVLKQKSIMNILRSYTPVETVCILKERGYDFVDISPGLKYDFDLPNRKILEKLVEFGTDFTSANWTTYWIYYLGTYMYDSQTIDEYIYMIKLFLDAGVVWNNDVVIETIEFDTEYITPNCNHSIVYDKVKHRFSYRLGSPSYPTRHLPDVCTFPTQILNLLISYGLDVSYTTIVHFDGNDVTKLKDTLDNLDVYERVIVTEFYD